MKQDSIDAVKRIDSLRRIDSFAVHRMSIPEARIEESSSD
jgi:hypothetical protein